MADDDRQQAMREVEDLIGGPAYRRQLEINKAQNERIIQQRNVSRIVAEGVGAMIGGGLGGVAARRLGPLALRRGIPTLARMVGAGAGSVAGQEAAVSPDRSGSQANQERIEAFVRGAVGEGLLPAAGVTFRALGNVPGVKRVGNMAGRGLDRIFRRFRAPGADKLVKGAEEAFEDQVGALPRPGQLTEQPTIDTIENISGGGILGAGVFRKAQQRAEAHATINITRFVQRFDASASDEATGAMLRSALENGAEGFRAAEDGIWNSFRRRFGTAALKDQADLADLAGSLKKRLGLGLKGQKRRAIGISDEILDRVSDGRKVNLDEAMALRSDLLKITRGEGEDALGGDAAVGTAKALAARLDNRIESTLARQYGDDAVREWRSVNAFSAAGRTAFNDQAVVNLMHRGTPEQVYRAGIRNADASQIRRVRRLTEEAASRSSDVDPKLWSYIQGEFLYDITNDVAIRNPRTGQISGEALARELDRLGPNKLKEIFPDGSHTQLRRLAQNLAIVQSKTGGEQNLGLFIKLAQGTAALHLAGDFVGIEPTGEGTAATRAADAAIILAPWAMARFLTQPSVVRWLSVGMKAPPGSRTAARAFGQLVARADQILEPGDGMVAEPQETQGTLVQESRRRNLNP